MDEPRSFVLVQQSTISQQKILIMYVSTTAIPGINLCVRQSFPLPVLRFHLQPAPVGRKRRELWCHLVNAVKTYC